jgi:hypothetical protein
MSLNLNAIDDLVLALEIFSRYFISTYLALTSLIIVLWKDRCLKLKVTAIQFEIHQLINQLAYHFAISWAQSLYFEILHVWQPEFLQIADHL